MKVSYEADIDRGEPVVYMEIDGALIIKGNHGHYVYIDEDGECVSYSDFDLEHVVKTFYKGPKITITF